jgi:hypothetical protein
MEGNGQPTSVRERVRQQFETYQQPPETMPAFGEILAAVDGSIWVGEYTTPDLEPSGSYRVINREGVWVSTVSVPTGLKILSISGDHVVGLTRTNLDVEVVSVHALDRG